MINLTFHGIGRERPGMPASEGWVWLSVSDFEAVLDVVAGRSDIRITFDDGNASDVEIALPALVERGLRATFFPVARRIAEPAFLDRDGIQALIASGMEIGSHGMSHRSWRRLSEAELEEELGASRNVLEEVTGRRVAVAACPFGAYDRRVLRALRRHDYQSVFTSDGGRARPDAWLQPRNTLERVGAREAVERLIRGERRSRRLLRAAKKTAKRLR